MGIRNFFIGALLIIVLLGCKAGTPPAFEPTSNFDSSKLTCDTLDQARADANKAYQDTLEQLSQSYKDAYYAFQADLQACLKPIWQNGPCDSEWKDVQDAYQKASGEISNDDFYNDYKAKSQAWKDCRAKDVNLDDWRASNIAKEKACNDEYTAKWSAAQDAYYTAKDKAKKKYDSDLSGIDEFAKRCKDNKNATTQGKTGTGTDLKIIRDDVNQVTDEGTTVYQPNSAPCTPAVKPKPNTIPGESSTPRQGHSPDYGPKDIIIDLATQAAEDVTGSVIPTNAINDQIFAGIVCVKLHSRITELYSEWQNWLSMGKNRLANKWEQKIKRYEAARGIWCKIAEGKPPVQIKEQVAQVQELPDGACQSDSDCGEMTCCSSITIGTPHCNTNTGGCEGIVNNCPANTYCQGDPGACKTKTVPRTGTVAKIDAIAYNGKYLPVSGLHKFKGDTKEECDMEEHWHANNGAVKATDGTIVPNPPGCGFGKTKDVPIIQVSATTGNGNGNVQVSGIDNLR